MINKLILMLSLLVAVPGHAQDADALINANQQPLLRYTFLPSGNHSTAGEVSIFSEDINSSLRSSPSAQVDGQLLTGYIYPPGGVSVHSIFNCQNWLLESPPFTSADQQCEGIGAGWPTGILADSASDADPIALYRCVNPATGDHMDTVSPNSECNGNGYQVEGVLGYGH